MGRTLAAAMLLSATPAAAQWTSFPAGSGLPVIGALETGRYNTVAADDITTRIDRRESARFQAAKAARKARERAERQRARDVRRG